MTVTYDSQRIRQALWDFWAATGIDIDLLKPDFSSACENLLHGNAYCKAIQKTPQGSLACQCSDRSLLEQCKRFRAPRHHICHAGLVDVAIPLIHADRIIGYIIFGRMRPNRDFSRLESYIASLGIDPAAAAEEYGNIPFYDEERIRSVSGIATLLVKYLLLEHLLSPTLSDPVDKAAAFIRANFSQDLSIQDIARGSGISKTVLYKAFHSRFDCTVGEFLNHCRIEASLPLLTDSVLSLEDISQRVGFSSASYYSKVFRKKMGQPPIQYRNTHKSKNR